MNTSDIISGLNSVANIHFIDSTISYYHKNPSLYIINGSPNSIALNQFKNDSSKINVVKWFDKAWVYSTIEFNKIEPLKIQIFSFSVFWGEENDSKKKQLFRAEWDFYDENDKHPQPHWHFYGNSQVGFDESFADLVEREEERSVIKELLEEKTTELFPIEKFHFAMNAKWSEKLGHIHDYDNVEEFISWFDGLLGHIRDQMSYAIK